MRQSTTRVNERFNMVSKTGSERKKENEREGLQKAMHCGAISREISCTADCRGEWNSDECRRSDNDSFRKLNSQIGLQNRTTEGKIAGRRTQMSKNEPSEQSEQSAKLDKPVNSNTSRNYTRRERNRIMRKPKERKIDPNNRSSETFCQQHSSYKKKNIKQMHIILFFSSVACNCPVQCTQSKFRGRKQLKRDGNRPT